MRISLMTPGIPHVLQPLLDATQIQHIAGRNGKKRIGAEIGAAARLHFQLTDAAIMHTNLQYPCRYLLNVELHPRSDITLRYQRVLQLFAQPRQPFIPHTAATGRMRQLFESREA